MLRIGKLTDYAMLILSQMAKESHVVLSASILAELLHLPLPTVSKVLKILADNGLVNSIRGADGGYHLARAPEAISIADVITAMEGDLAMTECCEASSLCSIETLCTMRENWRQINGTIHLFLARLSISDMLKPLSGRELNVK
jgi:FeS assembly SUF system regulator